MNKIKCILSISLIIVCTIFVSITFTGCRKKINNADIQLVLPGVTGDYKEIKYAFTELEPEGFVKAFVVNNNIYVIKSTDVWSTDGNNINIVTAIRNGIYINIVAKAANGSTISNEKLKKVQQELNYYINKTVTFVLNDSKEGAVTGYNYPKTLNTHYNVLNYINSNPNVMALYPQVNFDEDVDFNLNANEESGTPKRVNYHSTILSAINQNEKNYLVVKTVPQNLSNAFYSPYCSITLYVIIGENLLLEDYSVLELYCSPNSTSYRTPEQIKKILGISDFENNKDNINIAQGTLTSGAAWYALKAAKNYVNSLK